MQDTALSAKIATLNDAARRDVRPNIITCEICGGVVTWQLQKGRYYGACRRRNPACKIKKSIREDYLEKMV